MIDILYRTTKKHQIILSRPLHSKLKKIQGLFKDFPQNSRTFQDCASPISGNINNSGLNGLVSVSQGCMDPRKGLKGLHPQLQPHPFGRYRNFLATHVYLIFISEINADQAISLCAFGQCKTGYRFMFCNFS